MARTRAGTRPRQSRGKLGVQNEAAEQGQGQGPSRREALFNIHLENQIKDCLKSVCIKRLDLL